MMCYWNFSKYLVQNGRRGKEEKLNKVEPSICVRVKHEWLLGIQRASPNQGLLVSWFRCEPNGVEVVGLFNYKPKVESQERNAYDGDIIQYKKLASLCVNPLRKHQKYKRMGYLKNHHQGIGIGIGIGCSIVNSSCATPPKKKREILSSLGFIPIVQIIPWLFTILLPMDDTWQPKKTAFYFDHLSV